jgi:dihydroxyacetone kinase-like predicted kinase
MILSGFFAGFAEAVGDRHTLSPEDLARAFQIGSLRARERVEHPVEGTMLSVGEAAAQKAAAAAKHVSGRGGIFHVIHAAWEAAREASAKTKRQLKVLSEHHVVDAGGLGLVYFFEGLVRYSRRQSLEASEAATKPATAKPRVSAQAEVGKNHFCTEFLLIEARLTAAALRKRLTPLGEHLMVVSAPEKSLKVHLHTADPEAVFREIANAGRLAWRKVDDMAVQHRNAFGFKRKRR